MLKITYYPDPLLRQIAAPVTQITPELKELAQQMLQTMYEANGIGLAAPQVGRSIRLVVIHLADSDTRPADDPASKPLVLINPVITQKGKDKATAEEGCLSLPGLSAKVKRPAEVTVQALDLDGKLCEYAGEGIFARCLQHELDHLDGVLFIDKVSLAAKLSLRGELQELDEKFRLGQTPDFKPER